MTTSPRTKTLVLSCETPVPPNSGYRLRVLHLARRLAEAGDVDVAGLGPVPDDGREPFRLRGVPHRVSRIRSLLASWRQPYLAARFASRPMAELAAAGSWDVVQSESPWLVREALAAGAPVVLDAHNVEADIARSLAATDERAVHRLRWRWEAGKTARSEAWAVRNVDAVVACSTADAEALAAAGARRTLVVPNGVDTAAVAHQVPADGSLLLYVGQLGYRPNEAAAIRLIDDVLPLVRAEVADATVRIVGRDPTDAVLSRRGPTVDVPGEVPEVLPHLHAARVLVVPLEAGSGTRLKVLEAMAAGVPVVSTALGVAGIEAEHGRHLLVADTAAGLAEQAVRVIRDDDLARSLSTEARRLVEERYDWAVVAAPLVALHAELGRRGR